MWANAQRDGRPAQYRWRPVLNAAKFGSRPLLKCRAVTLPKYESASLGECKVNFDLAKIRNGARAPENVYVVYQPMRRPNTVQSLVGFC